MKLIFKKLSLVVAGLSVVLLPYFAEASTLDDLNSQYSSTAQQAADAKKKASELAKQADYLDTQIANINSQIAETQSALDSTNSQISDTESKIEELKGQIKVQEDNLAKENNNMNQIITAWYMEGGDTSITTAVLSSNTLSEVVTKQQYYDSIKQQIEATIEKINQLKADLDKQKADQDAKMEELSRLQSEQESYLRSSQYQKNTKNTLLSGTNQQKQDYLEKAATLQAEAQRISSAIYTLRQQLSSGSGETTQSGGSGYPFSGIDQPDPWGFLTRECTSYAAWYWNSALGRDWYRGDGPVGTGNASNWPSLATRNGASVHSSPQVGAIISWGTSASMPYGHVAIVESINSNGTIDLSEYNWRAYVYTYRTNVTPARYGSYSYIY